MQPFEQSKVALQALDIPDLAQRNLAALFERDGTAAALLAFYEEGGMLTLPLRPEWARRADVSLRGTFELGRVGKAPRR